MRERRALRFVVEALFLGALAAALVVADLEPLEIAGVMLLGWLVVALYEWAATRELPHYGRGLPPRYYVPQVALPPPRQLDQLRCRPARAIRPRARRPGDVDRLARDARRGARRLAGRLRRRDDDRALAGRGHDGRRQPAARRRRRGVPREHVDRARPDRGGAGPCGGRGARPRPTSRKPRRGRRALVDCGRAIAESEPEPVEAIEPVAEPEPELGRRRARAEPEPEPEPPVVVARARSAGAGRRGAGRGARGRSGRRQPSR